eukprot:1969072-Prymnesium_polylepis.1
MADFAFGPKAKKFTEGQRAWRGVQRVESERVRTDSIFHPQNHYRSIPDCTNASSSRHDAEYSARCYETHNSNAALQSRVLVVTRVPSGRSRPDRCPASALTPPPRLQSARRVTAGRSKDKAPLGVVRAPAMGHWRRFEGEVHPLTRPAAQRRKGGRPSRAPSPLLRPRKITLHRPHPPTWSTGRASHRPCPAAASPSNAP